MKKVKGLLVLIMLSFVFLLTGCDFLDGGTDEGKLPGENEVKVLTNESSLTGDPFEEVVSTLEGWGFTNIESVPVYDIVWGFTKPGTTKSVTINGSKNFKKGDIFDKNVSIIVTYSMPEGDDPVKQKYDITWQYEDGTIIKTDKVLWGITPNYLGTTPTKDNTDRIKYVFAGWSPEIVNVTENAIYTAQFDEEEMLYQISYFTPDKITSIVTGSLHVLVLSESGQVYSGSNGTNVKFDLNVGEVITKIQAGSFHSVALTSSGRVFTWGNNKNGSLGDGTLIDKSAPVDITELFYLSSNEKVINIFAGERGDHSLATTSNGRIFSWGYNAFGQLGDGTNGRKLIPVNITNYFGMTVGETIEFSLGNDHTVGVTSTGRIFSFGRNHKGQLGHGDNPDSLVPVMFNSLFSLYSDEKIIAVDASLHHSQAITSRGRIFSWGTGDSGQHGDGTYTDKLRPTDVTSNFNLQSGEKLTKAYSVGSHSFAITSLNRIFGWGHNLYGQSGDGTTISKAIPIEITNKFNFVDDEVMSVMAGGFYNSFAVTSKGKVYSWGQRSSSAPAEITHVYKKPILIKTESYSFEKSIIEYVPTRDGYSFGGWYIDDLFSELYIFNTMPAMNIELFVKWIPDNLE